MSRGGPRVCKLSDGGKRIRTCMGFFPSSGRFWVFAGSLFGAGKAVLRSLIAPQVAREFFSLEAISSPWAVDRPSKRIPLCRWGRLVPVANRRAPRASRSALTSDGAARAGGACLPTGASRGGTQPRFLNSCVQPGSWFFPRSARLSEPQLGVGEAGTAMSRARSTRCVPQRKTRGCPASSQRDALPPRVGGFREAVAFGGDPQAVVDGIAAQRYSL
jgi:hypothetical protein